MVSSAPPTSTASSESEGPFSPISSSLYGSAASSARASLSLTTRREKRWPCLTIWRIRASIAFRSSGANGFGTSKS